MLQIEWNSSLYHSDGRRRSRPKPSTVHGWLVKWRATFSGNERLRKEGIREMREAKAVRETKKQKKAARLAKAGPSSKSFLSCLWPIPPGKRRRRRTPKSVSQPPSAKRSSRKHTPTHSPKPTPTNSRRSSQTREGTGDSTLRNPRKASYSNRRAVVRVAERKR